MNTNNIKRTPIKTKIESNTQLKSIRKVLLSIIDFFYPIFKGFLPIKTYRYGVCGGGVALLNLFIYAFCNHFVVPKDSTIDLGFIQMQYYTGSFIIALMITFPIGFILNRYIVFPDSNLRIRTQLFRYGFMTAVNIILNYSLLHLLVGYWQLWPTPSQACITIFLALLSYLAQNYFSFRIKK